MEEEFPKLIWQTHRSIESITPELQHYIRSWISMNPSWEYHFCSDDDISGFFESFFPSGISEIYRMLPLGVMKADMWRYAVLHEFGGIYADVDTLCRQPIDEWLDVDGDPGLHVAREPEGPHVCQWIVASSKRHAVTAAAIDLIVERVRADGGVDRGRRDFASYYTGAGLWTDVIRKFLNCSAKADEILLSDGIWRGAGMVVYPGVHFDGEKAWHLNSSYHWKYLPSGYIAWMEGKHGGHVPV